MQFDDKFFAAIGLSNISDEEKAKLGEEIAVMVQDRVAVKLADMLSEDQLADLDMRVEVSFDNAQGYLIEVYPDYPLLVQSEIENVKQELARDMSELKTMMEDEDGEESVVAEPVPDAIQAQEVVAAPEVAVVQAEPLPVAETQTEPRPQPPVAEQPHTLRGQSHHHVQHQHHHHVEVPTAPIQQEPPGTPAPPPEPQSP